MQEVNRTYYFPKGNDVVLSEIKDGIYRITGFVEEYGITFNQFLINNRDAVLIHTGPIGMYEKIKRKGKREVIPLERLSYVVLHLE